MATLTLYFDRCFGSRVPAALVSVVPPGFKVEYHHNERNRYPKEMPDDEWLSIIGPRGWIVFTHDRKFHEEAPIVAAIRQHEIACFSLWGADAQRWDKLGCFVRGFKKIVHTVETVKRPYLFNVSQSGRLSQVDLP